MRPINYALPVPHEMGMVGLRSDVLFVPASSFHHNNHHHDPFISDHHHNHQHNHHSINNNSGNNSSATALGIGVIPLLTASTGGSSQLWQNQQTHNINYPKKTILIHHENSGNPINIGNNGAGVGVNVGFGIGGTNTTATTTISASAKTCQDCGNQAKKDCSHSRCRTCCKSRGYDCTTHVKSTWVSAARRRDRQLVTGTNIATDQGDGGGGGGASSGSTSAVKKPRLITSQTTASHTSTSNTTPPRSFDTSSSHHHQDASFREALPRQVRAPASFKCVRVTPIGDGEDEFAYQAIVKIGGHVFKGFLYNKGVVNGNEGMPNISELHLGGSSSGGGGGGKTWVSSSSPIIDPSDVYAATGSGLFGSGGTNFGNTIN